MPLLSCYIHTRMLTPTLTHFSYLFLLFSPDNVLRILTAILLEQRIIFLSNDYAILTPVIEVRHLILSVIVEGLMTS